MPSETEKTLTRIRSRWAALKSERSSWDPHWKEISDSLLPRAGRYMTSDRNKGQKRYNNIYDSTGTRGLRILSAGMMAGMTSPARPWFRLATGDANLSKSYAVRLWMSDVTRLMLDVFQRSNLYRALHGMYEELGAFGTSACIILPDYNDVIRCYPLTVGEYAISTDFRGQVNTLYREFELTVGQLVDEFGLDSCSDSVRDAHARGRLDDWVPVIHAIEPRENYDSSKIDSLNMPFRSCYFESSAGARAPLRESGFRRFPAICPRWSTTGGDIYGTGPGMEALGDIKQLQHEQLRKAQGIDYMTKPPLQVPLGLKNREIETLPGGVTYVDASSPSGGIRSAFEVRLDLSHLLADIQDVRQRINSVFFADMFMMMANDTRSNITATEVAERHEEKLLMLGPVLERLNNEMLDPLVEMTFDYMMEAGIVPPPPEELQGQDIRVEFVSMLAQAQRAIGINSIDRFVSSLAGMAQIKPDVLDKLNSDKWADIYADSLGVDPEVLLSDDAVSMIREARSQQAQQAQQSALMNQAADTAQKMAAAKTGEKNALTDVAGMFSGYSSPGILQ